MPVDMSEGGTNHLELPPMAKPEEISKLKCFAFFFSEIEKIKMEVIFLIRKTFFLNRHETQATVQHDDLANS